MDNLDRKGNDPLEATKIIKAGRQSFSNSLTMIEKNRHTSSLSLLIHAINKHKYNNISAHRSGPPAYRSKNIGQVRSYHKS